jgi:predicted ATP-grasp superfamily ATP-dependent carboligase
MCAALEHLLVVSLSAQALAWSARRGGWACVALDAFGDEDTRACAQCWARVGASNGRFDPQALLAAVARLRPRGGYAGLVYGSGLGHSPELLAALAERVPVLGNPPEVLRRVKDPRAFFALLDELGIGHPQNRFAPAAGDGWLLKQAGGSGGMHVRAWSPGRGLPQGAYLQRRLPGEAVSVLFLADTRIARIIGFNTLWCAEGHSRGPYAYGGAINRARLSSRQRHWLTDCVQALVVHLGLRGLNVLDAVCGDETLRVLELNPRPGASFALYEPEIKDGLVRAHMEACQGRLAAPGWPPPSPPRAQRVVYTPWCLRIPRAMAWPCWVSDRPPGGATIRAGEPLCTVRAEGAGLRARVRARRDSVLASLHAAREVA